MTTHCAPELRQRARRYAAHLEARDAVHAAHVVPADVEPTDRWTLDVTLQPDAGGLAPPVLTAAGCRGLTARDVSPQGAHWQALLTL